ncbi:MAG: hypothetical protein GY750_03760 [Lentisphaerae bacterium]|nr:hypothetical protein [Lentisphaerota bacterium]
MKMEWKKAPLLAVCLSALLVGGCSSQEGEMRSFTKNTTHCDLTSADKRSDFILQCLKNANPESDEEPEDWIRQCQTMAEQTICPIRQVEITEECRRSTFGSCDYWREFNRELVAN